MINLNELTSPSSCISQHCRLPLAPLFCGRPASIKPFGKQLSPCAETPNHSGNDFRNARKHQTIREITFAIRGNTKPFGKWLSPCAETPNHSGNDFRQARKSQTIWETTFAMRGNNKPFAEWFAGGPQAPNPFKSDLRKARKGYKRKKHSEEMNLQSAL